jgi:hypothetical protein
VDVVVFFNTDFDSTYFCSRSCPFRVLLHTPALFCPFERFTSCSRYFVCPLLSLSLLLDPKFPHKFRWCFVVSLSGRPLCLCPHPKPFTRRRRRRRRDENIVVVFVLFSRASDKETKKAQQQHQRRRDSFVVSNSRICALRPRHHHHHRKSTENHG